MALVGTPRSARADGIDRLAVALHEALFHHDVRLGRQQIVAVLSEHVQGSGSDRKPHLEQSFLKDGACASSLPEPAIPTAAAVRIDELAVPSTTTRPRIGLRVVGVVQHRALIDGTVHGARLHSHDERDGRAVQGRRLGYVGRGARTRGGRIRLELLVERRQVDVLDARRDRAIHVQRHAERCPTRGRELLRLTQIRRLMRSGHDRARDRVVDDLHFCGGTPVGNPGLDLVVPVTEPLDQSGECGALPDQAERFRHIIPVARHFDLGGVEVGADFDAKQDIAASDQMRTGGQAHDAEIGGSQRAASVIGASAPRASSQC